MNDWVAIDFETASTRGTPCAVGLIEVERGRIVQRHGWLIRPPVFEFWPFNVALHGIGPEMCERAPDWEESLAEILAITHGRPLVAHNASFDTGVIRDACDVVGRPWPAVDYACTLVMSRRLWPDLVSHSLMFVAAYLGLDDFVHHDPAGDAMASAGIALAALNSGGCSDVRELAKQLGIAVGSIERDMWSGCHGLAAPLPTEPSADAEIDSTNPLFGRCVAFTGALAITRRTAQQVVVDHGGQVTRGVTHETDLLVTGFQDLSKLAIGTTKSAKLRKAEALKTGGQPIEIIDEADFVQLLAGHDVALRGRRNGKKAKRLPV